MVNNENVPCIPRALLRVHNALNNGWLITGMIHALAIKYALISRYAPINQTLPVYTSLSLYIYYLQHMQAVVTVMRQEIPIFIPPSKVIQRTTEQCMFKTKQKQNKTKQKPLYCFFQLMVLLIHGLLLLFVEEIGP